MTDGGTDDCAVCGAADEQLDRHHVSYDPERTVPVCRACHAEIHHTDKHGVLTPDPEDAASFYNRENTHVDTSAIPSRPGWSVQVKYNQCGKDACENCPHGPYYYYVRRVGEGVEWDYGGRVTDMMIVDQTTLGDFGVEESPA